MVFTEVWQDVWYQYKDDSNRFLEKKSFHGLARKERMIKSHFKTSRELKSLCLKPYIHMKYIAEKITLSTNMLIKSYISYIQKPK